MRASAMVQSLDFRGRTCLCQGGPVCRHHHRDKQAPGWHLEHAHARGWFRWTTASGRKYTTKPTQYPDLSASTATVLGK